jgi:hypothetical protein
LVFSFKITVMVLSPRKKMKPCVWFQSGYWEKNSGFDFGLGF